MTIIRKSIDMIQYMFSKIDQRTLITMPERHYLSLFHIRKSEKQTKTSFGGNFCIFFFNYNDGVGDKCFLDTFERAIFLTK